MLDELELHRRKKFGKVKTTRFLSIDVLTKRYKNTYNMMLGLPVPARTRMAPYGYRKEGNQYLPIESVFHALVKAKHYLLNGMSYREVAQWLSFETGMYYSFTKLNKLMRERPPDDMILEVSLEERMKMRLE